MSARAVVWAFRQLPQLDHRCGFIECDEEMALSLIASGEAQDPRVGALHLREIEDTALHASAHPATAHEYHTTQLTPASGKKRRPAP